MFEFSFSNLIFFSSFDPTSSISLSLFLSDELDIKIKRKESNGWLSNKKWGIVPEITLIQN